MVKDFTCQFFSREKSSQPDRAQPNTNYSPAAPRRNCNRQTSLDVAQVQAASTLTDPCAASLCRSATPAQRRISTAGVDAIRLRFGRSERWAVEPTEFCNCRNKLFISVPLGNSKEARGTNQPLAVAGQLQGCSLNTDELDGCRVSGIRRANWSRKRI
jgi:hypothetical protein